MANTPAEKSSKKGKPKCNYEGGDAKDAAAKSKFVMRNAHFQKSLQNVYIAVGLSLTSAVAFYLFHNRRRKMIYKRFYENYDAEEAYTRMVEGGWLTSMEDSGSDDKKKNK